MDDPSFQAMQHPVTGVALKSRKVLRPLAMGYKRYIDEQHSWRWTVCDATMLWQFCAYGFIAQNTLWSCLVTFVWHLFCFTSCNNKWMWFCFFMFSSQNRYKECFSGTDGVSWLAANLRESRVVALARLHTWLDSGFITRIGGAGPFEG
jgi:hypothetical protein